MENVCNEGLYDEVASDLGLPKELIKSIANAQSLFTKHIIETGLFEGVRYVYLGKITAKVKKIQQLNEAQGNK